MGGIVEARKARGPGEGEVELGVMPLARTWRMRRTISASKCSGPVSRKRVPASPLHNTKWCPQRLAGSQRHADGGVLLDQDALHRGAGADLGAGGRGRRGRSQPRERPCRPWARTGCRHGRDGTSGSGRCRASVGRHGRPARRRRPGHRRAGRRGSRRRWRRWRCTAAGAGTRAAPACPSGAGAGRGDPVPAPAPAAFGQARRRGEQHGCQHAGEAGEAVAQSGVGRVFGVRPAVAQGGCRRRS